MSVSVIIDKQKTTFPDATDFYIIGGTYHIANGPEANHGNNTIYAVVTAATPCIVINEDAVNKIAKPTDPIQFVIDVLFNPILRMSLSHISLVRMKQLLNDYNTKTQTWKQ